MNEPEAGKSDKVSLKAAERLRKKKLSRTEAETISLIHELEARRIQLDMHKALANENALKASTDIEKLTNEERLQELNLTKDKFLSIIAHDLKSAFNSIIGLGNLLAEKVRKKDYEEVETFAYIIQESSWKAMGLLTNLLEWSRSQTGRIEFNPHDIEILELISDVCEFLKESASEKSIKISVEDPQNAIVFCDKEMISTVLRNLISNAIKFTERNGFIIVSVTREESFSRISVGDNGIGMRKEVVEKLFRIEESFSTTGTAGEEGTGMGLLLCKDFIDRHKGQIWAESEPEKGTRIIFELPARTASLHSNS